jgi:hypothetical protein
MTISPADDFMIHQTPDPIRWVGTSDRRFYDRHFLTGHSRDGQVAFLCGIGVYPNLGVIDCFASVTVGNTQYTTRASRELGHDRMNTAGIGPFALQILEGLRTLRFTCAPHEDQLVSLDLRWDGSAPAFAEPPLFSRVMDRVMDAGTRIIQTGTWSGHIRVAGREFEVTPDQWQGGRDRSWGVRSMGMEREPRGIQHAHQVAKSRTTLWIWSPMQFRDRTVHFSLSEFPDGQRDVNTVRESLSYERGGELRLLSEPDHELVLDPHDRELHKGQVSWREAEGSRRTVHLTPISRIYLRAGTGYGGPDPWRHGTYMGREWVDSVSFDLTDPAVTTKIGPTHVMCRMEADDGEIGYGTFEVQVFGAHERYGFSA